MGIAPAMPIVFFCSVTIFPLDLMRKSSMLTTSILPFFARSAFSPEAQTLPSEETTFPAFLFYQLTCC